MATRETRRRRRTNGARTRQTEAAAHLTTPTRADGRGDYLGHAGGRRRYRRLRLSRRRDSAGLRCAAQVSHPARAGAARAGRGAHGRRLRARLGQGGRGHCHQRSRRDQSRHRHRHGHAGLDSHRLHHRQRVEQGAGHGRVSGSRHHRHHAAGDQAQFSGEQGRGHGAGAAPCVPDRAFRPSRAGAGRYYQRRAAGHGDLRL